MRKPRGAALAPIRGALLACLLILEAAPPADPVPQVRPAAADLSVLVEAYREDLMDLDAPMFLGLEEAQILAEALHLGTRVFRVTGDLPRPGQGLPIEVCQDLNPFLQGPQNREALLFEARHFKVLAPAGPEVAEYWHGTQDAGYRAATRIPGDGHCLIASLWYLKERRLPEPQEVAAVRGVLAASLTDEQVREALHDFRIDLLRNASARPFANGRFSGWGPRVSLLLEADPALVAARQEAARAEAAMVEQVLREQEALEEARREQQTLEAAIRLSLLAAPPESPEPPAQPEPSTS